MHIPEVMTKSFGCVWVIRQKICEEVPARAKNQEEREEKKENFVETRREFTFLLFVFFSSTPTDCAVFFSSKKNFVSFFHQSRAFSFLFCQPTWQKKDTYSRASELSKQKK